MSIINWLRRNIVLVFVGIVAVVFVGLAVNAWASDDDSGNAQTSSATATATLVSEVLPTAKAPDDGNTTAVCPGDAEIKDPRPDSGKPTIVDPGCIVKGDVEVNGQKLYDDDPTTGLLVSCPHGCTITAPWGANVSPRTVDDLKSEMLSTGCDAGCTDVKVVTIDDSGSKPSSVICDVSLPKGTTATVPGGCVISGDVFVNGQAEFDSDQTTGLVVIVESPVEVFAPYGASVTNANPDDVVNAVKQTGCGLVDGCRIVNIVTVP